MKVIDSDLIIAILKNNQDAVKKLKELSADNERLSTTVINAQEVLAGAKARENRKQFKDALRFFDALDPIGYDLDSVHQEIEIDNFLRKKGTPIGAFDTIIAGICVSHGATIVTRNIDHFKHVPGLSVEKW
ncbi:MAG: PIN domain-containing protein [Nanoarchaeota archaeon]